MTIIKKMIWEGEEYEKVSGKLNKLIGQMEDNLFWTYVHGWFDEQILLDIINGWDLETKKDAIKDIKILLKEQ